MLKRRDVLPIRAFVLLGLIVLAGCNSSEPISLKRTGAEPINVVCTTGMIADLVEQVGGKHVKVTQLMGEGTDPHLYKSSPGDVSKLAKADMIFYSGLHLEGNLDSAFKDLAKQKPVFAVTDEISRWAPSKILREGKMPDPHVWFDVSLWAMTVKLIADRLSDFDPEHASEFIDNANALSAKLESLHAECQSAIAEIPKSQRVLITAHDAFRYFERAYGFQVKAIQGVSTVAAASTKHMEELTNFIVEHKIKAIFVETSVPDDNVKQLIESCERQNHKLVIGGKLFSDAMGKPGTTDGTYIGMIRRNFKTIVKALK